MKKGLAILIAVLIFCANITTVFCVDNLIKNGDFSEFDGEYPAYWEIYSSDLNALNNSIHISRTSSGSCLEINHKEPGYSYADQYVFIEGKKNYRFSCDLTIDASEEDTSDFVIYFGEYLFLPTDFALKNAITKNIEFYIEAITDYDGEIRFDFGAYKPAVGTIRISNVEMREFLGTIPAGSIFATVAVDYLIEEPQIDETINEDTDIDRNIAKDKTENTIFYAIFLVLFLIISALFYIKLNGRISIFKTLSTKSWLIIILLSGALIKLIASYSVFGYYYDMSCFSGWANGMVENSFSGFYTSGIFCDYPPGYMYILYGLGSITGALNLGFSSPLQGMVIKIPSIIADVLIALLAYKLANKRLNTKFSLLIAAAIMFNPAFLVDGSLWGQVDAVITLFMLLTLYFLAEDKKLLGALMFAFALLIKPQALILAPVLILPYINSIINKETRKKGIIDLLLSLSVGLGVMVLFILPFSLNQASPLWVLDKYFGTALSYPYASLNAYNLYAAIGANFAVSSEPFLFLTYQTWSYIFVALICGACAFLYFKSENKKNSLFLIGAFIFFAVFMLGPNMHERYIIPAIYMLVFALIYKFDFRILSSFIALTVLGALNLITVLNASEYAPQNEAVIALSILIIGLFAYFCFSVYKQILSKNTIENTCIYNWKEKDTPDEISLSLPDNTGAKLNKRDKIIVFAITLIYAVVAFVNLGTLSVPQSGFYPEKGDKIYVEFDNTYDIAYFKYYSGLGEGYFNVNGMSMEKQNDYMYKWQVVPVKFVSDSATIETTKAGYDMLEFAFCDASGKPVPIKKAEINGVSSDIWFDEQEFVPQNSGDYMTDMYFDEVYHARTAKEHIDLITPYEITHPPLGKIIIALGINIFGMNPFGWRFMGTLFGVLMLPIMYIFAKKLFKNTLLAFIPTFLFAVDFMHFSLTRIATIDSFSIVFIMLMYYFMYNYTQTNFNLQPLRKTLIPLGFCSLAFALGAATKWLCVYAGLGLAVILFYQLFLRMQEFKYALSRLSELNEEDENYELYKNIAANYRANLYKTLFFCVIMFIIVPAIIYFLSYIPYMMVKDNPYTFEQILQNQSYMLNYHGNLTVETPHPFASKWYTWPLNIRPIFFYRGDVSENYISGISSFGNPAVWWGGLIAVIALAVLKLNKKKFTKGIGLIAVAIGSQFLPWVIISRETFIYHYFASIPFLIIMLTYFCKYIMERFKHGKKYIAVYLAVCLLLFIMFYPVITGTPVPVSFSDTFLRWLPTWPFY